MGKTITLIIFGFFRLLNGQLVIQDLPWLPWGVWLVIVLAAVAVVIWRNWLPWWGDAIMVVVIGVWLFLSVCMAVANRF